MVRSKVLSLMVAFLLLSICKNWISGLLLSFCFSLGCPWRLDGGGENERERALPVPLPFPRCFVSPPTSPKLWLRLSCKLGSPSFSLASMSSISPLPSVSRFCCFMGMGSFADCTRNCEEEMKVMMTWILLILISLGKFVCSSFSWHLIFKVILFSMGNGKLRT